MFENMCYLATHTCKCSSPLVPQGRKLITDSHQYFVIPPIVILTAIYWPLLGRREYIKIIWLALMVSHAVGQAEEYVGYSLHNAMGQCGSRFADEQVLILSSL